MPLHFIDKRPTLNRLDSEFEATHNVSDKEFAERFFALFVAVSVILISENKTRSLFIFLYFPLAVFFTTFFEKVKMGNIS